MYKIKQINVDGFWGSMAAEATLHDQVNIIIGKNGSGKTTFMNILYAVLSVDLDLLNEASFSSVIIKIVDGKKVKTIKATKTENPKSPFPIVAYMISNKSFYAHLVTVEEGRMISPSARRRLQEEATEIKQQLGELVSLASLSVYRMGSDVDPDTRDRQSRKVFSPVELRLESLTKRLALYQLELSDKARKISADLQREVLMSLLYQKEKISKGIIPDAFDESSEAKSLTQAYERLGLRGHTISQRIQQHVQAVKSSVAALEKWDGSSEPNSFPDFAPLDAFKLTSKIVAMSLQAERDIKEVFRQPDGFIEILKKFIPEKQFKFVGGELEVNHRSALTMGKLSSGEKQLLILFIEALLQREVPCIFMADEPELSLHISWQREIISAIRLLNPNSQIIVATHAPEIAGRHRDFVIKMEEILHG